MRTPWLLPLGLVCVLVGSLLPATASARARRREALLAAEQALFQAIRGRDRAALAALLAPDFHYRTPGVRDLDRDGFLRMIAGLPDAIEDVGSDDLAVELYGATGVVSGVQKARVRGADGQVIIGRAAFVDVFVWRRGRWSLTLAYGVELPEAGAGEGRPGPAR